MCIRDSAFYIANPGGRANEEQVRNSILHEFGHTLGLRHWGAAKYVEDFAEGSPMQDGYHSVMNYNHQFDYFNYSEQPYFANTPQGRVLIPADWDSLEMDSPRIGVYAESIGARADITDKADAAEAEEVAQPEEIVETTQPEPVEVAEEHEMVELVPAEEIPAVEAESQPGVTPTKQPKAEAKVQAEEVKPAKAEAPKQTNTQPSNQPNIAAIIGGVIAALAALGIGAAFLAMR